MKNALKITGGVFVILKIVGVITWSWIWVTLPLWIGVVSTIIIIHIVAIFYFLKKIFNKF